MGFKRKVFDKISKISGNTVIREFGTWEKALVFLRDYFKKQGVELKVSNRKSRKQFNEQQLFNEMERIWKHLGHRPSINEWNAMNPKISFATYLRYFNGWQSACLKFIEYKMDGNIIVDDEIMKDKNVHDANKKDDKNPIIYKSENLRTIPLGIRLKVLDRDNFRYMFCGRSPATEAGVKLHIDHMVPFSKGGKSILENLQTLCEECNIGKSDRQIKRRQKRKSIY